MCCKFARLALVPALLYLGKHRPNSLLALPSSTALYDRGTTGGMRALSLDAVAPGGVATRLASLPGVQSGLRGRRWRSVRHVAWSVGWMGGGDGGAGCGYARVGCAASESHWSGLTCFLSWCAVCYAPPVPPPPPPLQFPHEVVTAVCDALDEYVQFCLAVSSMARAQEVASMFDGALGGVDAKAVGSPAARRARANTAPSQARAARHYGLLNAELPQVSGLLKFITQLASRMSGQRRRDAGQSESSQMRAERRELCTWLVRAVARAVNKLSPTECPEYTTLLECANTIGCSTWPLASLFVRLLSRSWKPADGYAACLARGRPPLRSLTIVCDAARGTLRLQG